MYVEELPAAKYFSEDSRKRAVELDWRVDTPELPGKLRAYVPERTDEQLARALAYELKGMRYQPRIFPNCVLGVLLYYDQLGYHTDPCASIVTFALTSEVVTWNDLRESRSFASPGSWRVMWDAVKTMGVWDSLREVPTRNQLVAFLGLG